MRDEIDDRPDDQLGRARARIDELERELATRTDWARGLDDEVLRARARIAELEHQLADRTTWALSLDKDLEHARAEIADLWRAIATVDSTASSDPSVSA